MPSAEQEASSAATLVTMGAREFKLFRELIHKETGIWLRDGKEVMLASRLATRLRDLGLADFAAYYEFAINDRDGNEMRELTNRITTNKTSFFRENQHFDYLTRTLVPERRQAAAAGAARTIRIWSAASSTGEEAYSIIITLLEAFPQHAAGTGGWTLEVVASDIDTKVLETARRGVYPVEYIDTVPTPLRAKYFLRGKDHMAGKVQAKKEIRQRVTFRHVNLIHPTWNVDGLFDAIFFRNALIYFTQETQSTVLRKMLRFLKPKGYLFLGHSEHVPWLHDAVLPLNQTIYQLRDANHSPSRD